MGIFGREPEGKPPEPPLTPPARAASTPPADKDKDGKAAASAPVPAKPGTCIIGAKTVIKGEITGDEDVVVDGTVEGQIRITRDLRVGAAGVVKATVEAQSIIVSGELVGDCQATVRVEIQSTGKLTGNIRAPKIVIAEGAMFRGNSDMSARKDDKKVASL
jgi:cytoskeletal protein CcmA (bactofilin family)